MRSLWVIIIAPWYYSRSSGGMKGNGETMKPTYFDFTVKDLGAPRRFFEQGFGWCFEKLYQRR